MTPPAAAGLLQDEAWLEQEYVLHGRTLREIGHLAGGAAPWTVARALERVGIARRPRGKRPGQVPLPAPLSDAAWVREQYVQLGLSLEQVAARAASSPRRVARALREHGIPPRARTRKSPSGREEP